MQNVDSIINNAAADEEWNKVVDLLVKKFLPVYYINFREDYMRTCSNMDKNSPFGEVRSYSAVMRHYIEHNVAGKDRERMRVQTSPVYIKDKLAEQSCLSVEYVDNADGVEKFYEAHFIRAGADADQIVLCCYDRSEEVKQQQRYQRSIEEALDRAEAANRSKSSFLFNMSHDIRTPMNAIIGFTNMARKHIDDRGRVADALEKVAAASDQLLGIIGDVLDMARIESGKVVLHEADVNIRDYSMALAGMMKERADAKQIEFDTDFVSLPSGRVSADSLRLNQVLLNILSNAIKFTPTGGRVTFRAEETEGLRPGFGCYIFTVIDNGVGMSRSFTEHIFDSFTRESTATISGVPGTGLGMSITKQLIDMMGGDITIESERGLGTAVRVVLEFRKLAEEPAAVRKNSIEDIFDVVRIDGMRLLLVEDNEINREIAREILTEDGAVVDEAEDGSIAVDMVAKNPAGTYDAVLMDIQMPIMNGYEATKAIRSLEDGDRARVPILAMTANAFPEDREQALKVGMNDHIPKPIVIKSLINALLPFYRKK